MKNKKIQDDLFLKELFKELPKGKLSIDFSDQIMDKIWKEEFFPIRIEPLISRQTWIILAGIVVALFTFVIFQSTGTEPYPEITSFLENIYSYLSNIKIPVISIFESEFHNEMLKLYLSNIKIPVISISLNVLYGVLALFVLVIGDAFHSFIRQNR